jgi:hypothetical protein
MKSPIKNIQKDDLEVCSKIPLRKIFHKVVYIEACLKVVDHHSICDRKFKNMF